MYLLDELSPRQHYLRTILSLNKVFFKFFHRLEIQFDFVLEKKINNMEIGLKLIFLNSNVHPLQQVTLK